MNWINKTNDNKYVGSYLNTKFIISINTKQDKDINIIKGFYGLLDISYKSKEVMNNNLNHVINKMIQSIE
jgi:hypothetical protein